MRPGASPKSERRRARSSSPCFCSFRAIAAKNFAASAVWCCLHLVHELEVALLRLLLDEDGEVERVLQAQRGEVDRSRPCASLGLDPADGLHEVYRRAREVTAVRMRSTALSRSASLSKPNTAE